MVSATSRLDAFFDISSRGSSVRTEVLAGLSTFLALAYIVVVNPAILAEGGIDRQAAFFATVLVAGIGTIVMGVWARLPFALAPGMEMNAYVAFFVIQGLGFTWQQALGAVFWSGIAFLAVSLSGLRARVLHSIPPAMKAALALSVGVFIGLVALKICGILVFDGVHVSGVGSFTTLESFALWLGLAVILVLRTIERQFPGAVLISIGLTALVITWFAAPTTGVAVVPVWTDLLTTFAQLELAIILRPEMWTVILVLFLVDFYGSVAKLAGLSAATSIDGPEGPPRMKEALLVDSSATVAGAILGTSNLTVYVESGVGIAEGGRTGLTAVVCGVGLLLCLAIGGIVNQVPIAATGGALLFVTISLLPRWQDLKRLDLLEVLTIAGMQLAVVMTFAIDRAFLVGAAGYILRDVWHKRQPDRYLLGSAIALIIGLLLQA